MQSFMIKKGLIDSSLTEEEMLEFMEKQAEEETIPKKTKPRQNSEESNLKDSLKEPDRLSPLERVDKQLNVSAAKKRKVDHPEQRQENQGSVSEATIYKRAIRQLDHPLLDSQIEQLLE